MHRVDKPIIEKSKGEIEKKLSGMGDYVKMSYLQRAIRSGLDFDTKKFAMTKLADIYEQRKMFLEAAKMIKDSADINTTFKRKIEDFMRAVQLCIKGGDYAEADRLFSQTLALGTDIEKYQMKKQLKDFYISQGKLFVSNGRRNYARVVFEKCLTLELDVNEKKEVQEYLLDLYDKLGFVREYYALKDSM